jgi:hypothetical protein
VTNAIRFDGQKEDDFATVSAAKAPDRKIGKDCDSLVLVQGNISPILGQYS